MDEEAKRPLISIVIPTKDSHATLGRCLDSISMQGFKDYELILVDCHSKDGTDALAAKHGAKVIESDAGRSAARNLGFGAAKGDIFVSIDSDMILEPSVLSDIKDGMDRYDALIIPEVGYGDDLFSRCKDLEKRCYIGDPLVEAARAFTRKSFQDAGGYDIHLVFGEDWDLHGRLASGKNTIGRVSSRIMHDTSSASPFSQIRKAYTYGRTLPSFLAKKRPQAANPIDIRQTLFVRHFDTLRKEPVHATVLLLIKGLEYAFGLAGFISSKAGL
jgi:glycosyltransferase involved in cell wall biosynthesis